MAALRERIFSLPEVTEDVRTLDGLMDFYVNYLTTPTANGTQKHSFRVMEVVQSLEYDDGAKTLASERKQGFNAVSEGTRIRGAFFASLKNTAPAEIRRLINQLSSYTPQKVDQASFRVCDFTAKKAWCVTPVNEDGKLTDVEIAIDVPSTEELRAHVNKSNIAIEDNPISQAEKLVGTLVDELLILVQTSDNLISFRFRDPIGALLQTKQTQGERDELRQQLASIKDASLRVIFQMSLASKAPAMIHSRLTNIREQNHTVFDIFHAKIQTKGRKDVYWTLRPIKKDSDGVLDIEITLSQKPYTTDQRFYPEILPIRSPELVKQAVNSIMWATECNGQNLKAAIKGKNRALPHGTYITKHDELCLTASPFIGELSHQTAVVDVIERAVNSGAIKLDLIGVNSKNQRDQLASFIKIVKSRITGAANREHIYLPLNRSMQLNVLNSNQGATTLCLSIKEKSYEKRRQRKSKRSSTNIQVDFGKSSKIPVFTIS